MDPEAESVIKTVLDVAPLRRRVEFGDGYVWIPGLNDRSFGLSNQIREALIEKGHSCGSRHRVSHGIRLSVPASTEVSTEKITEVMMEVKTAEEATWGEY
jgi:hypothetical protein